MVLSFTDNIKQRHTCSLHRVRLIKVYAFRRFFLDDVTGPTSQQMRETPANFGRHERFFFWWTQAPELTCLHSGSCPGELVSTSTVEPRQQRKCLFLCVELHPGGRPRAVGHLSAGVGICHVRPAARVRPRFWPDALHLLLCRLSCYLDRLGWLMEDARLWCAQDGNGCRQPLGLVDEDMLAVTVEECVLCIMCDAGQCTLGTGHVSLQAMSGHSCPVTPSFCEVWTCTNSATRCFSKL